MGFIVQKMQEAICKVEKWEDRWGFRFSVVFTRKRNGKEVRLKLYNQDL